MPQGSVLGPLLFLLFINDLAGLDIGGKFTIFADDTAVSWHARDAVALDIIISQDLQKIKSWCDSNLLSLNFNKTNILSFRYHVGGLEIGDSTVESRVETKYLGLIIDRELKFESHITELSKKVASGCYAIKVIVNELGAAAARTVYYSLIESRLRYGIAFWGMSSLYLINSLFILQKRAIRYLSLAKPRDSCRPLFIKEKILTIYSLFILETVCLIYKNRNNLIPHNTRYTTRQHLNLPLPIPSMTLTKKSLIYESIKMYNHLPNSMKCLPTLSIFKRKVRRILLGKAYYSLSEYYNDTL